MTPKKDSGAKPDQGSNESPFKWVKFLSWSSLLVILATSLALSIIIANSARGTLLEKQRQFALLLAENLNHQIFQRFTLPTILRFGRIELQQEEQYEQLAKVIEDTVHGLHVMELTIYDADRVVSYSTNQKLVGKKGLASDAVRRVLDSEQHSFEIISWISPVWAMFDWEMDAESVVMRTVYPLRTERTVFKGAPSGTLMGILEFTQDITGDYGAVINFQWLIIVASFVSSLIMFLILLTMIRYAGKINTQRMLEMHRLERDLLESERLAGMGRVVAGIAHEIRNPLGIIRSSAEHLSKRMSAGPDTTIAQAMLDEIKRLSQTVNDFLDYARPRQPKPVDVDVSRVLDQALVFLEHECRTRGVEVVRDYPDGLTVQGDKDLLYRAFYNIMANALQAMDGKGRVRVSGSTTDKGVELVFRDTGPGFDSGTVDKLADPFFSTKEHGTGLGLAITATILEGHKAEMTFGNHPDGGAVVTIAFTAN